VYGQGKRKKKDTANITLHKKIANAEQHLKDVGGGYLFFQIIQIIFDIEENTTIRLFRLNLSIFKHNLPFIALSNDPPFMLQSTSKFVYVFIKWHVCIVIISLFLHTTSPASSSTQSSHMFHFRLN
jgi:hypothetical protein